MLRRACGCASALTPPAFCCRTSRAEARLPRACGSSYFTLHKGGGDTDRDLSEDAERKRILKKKEKKKAEEREKEGKQPRGGRREGDGN